MPPFLSTIAINSKQYFNNLPIPKDNNLPLPAPEWLLVGLIIFSFAVHIIFVNFMVGGAILTTYYEIKAKIKKDKNLDKMALMITKTITANKSLAVVWGVGPLLTINVLYSLYFYAANAITANAWISLIPLIASLFLTMYLYKYTWQISNKNNLYKNLHIALSVLISLTFCFIPLIFLANINLMLFPDLFTKVKGFFEALKFWNVFARYFHFLTACIALTGLFLVWYIRHKDQHWCKENGIEKISAIKLFYNYAMWPTILQLIFGPIVFFTLPDIGINYATISSVLIGPCVALIAVIMIHKQIQTAQETKANKINLIFALFFITILIMLFGRHSYRQKALNDHSKLVQQKTKIYFEKLHNTK